MTSSEARPSILDANRRLGSICALHPSHALVNLADASARPQTTLYGTPRGSGQVGEYVLVEVDHRVIIGRVTSIRLVERERLAINPSMGEPIPVDPIAEVGLLATLDAVSGELSPGIEASPRLGAAVYSPAPALLADLVSKQRGSQSATQLDLGTAMAMPEARVRISPERLFGRHCAILGATGGGKSFTIAKLLEEISRCEGKSILIDATGEFYTLTDQAEHLALGLTIHDEDAVHLPLSALDEQDLYALFQPSGKVQGPKLREAIFSLRIAHILTHSTDPLLVAQRASFVASGLLKDGLIQKSDQERQQFEALTTVLRAQIEAPNAPFDVTLLSSQITHECVSQNWKNPTRYGAHDDAADGWCSPLTARIQTITRGTELRVFFNKTGDDLLDRIGRFLSSPQQVLRISLASVPYSFNAREIVANALGRWLLRQARDGVFKRGKPTVLVLDEAHNFLNRRIGEEDSVIKLDAFDQIAKEGRKHWLTIALATQRPRDLPEGVLSQMGTMLVHRLTNHRDREVVERACGDIDRTSVALLPTFGPGHAAIIGVDFPFPLTVLIDKPVREPDSRGPQYQQMWTSSGEGNEPSDDGGDGNPLASTPAAPSPQSASPDDAEAAVGIAVAATAPAILEPFVLPLNRPSSEDDLPF